MSVFGVIGASIGGTTLPASPTIDGAGLNALLATAAASGASVTLPAGATIQTTVTINVPSGTRLYGNGATIANHIDGSVANGTWFPTVQLNRVDDVLVENLTIDGRKSAVAQTTEWRHGIKIKSSTNVTLRRVTSNDNKGDGVYIGGDDWLSSPNTRGTYSETVLMEDVTCLRNHRQGLSITSARNIRVLRGDYSDTDGTLPESGCDVEPNFIDDIAEDIVFEGAKFNRNAGSGILIDLINDSTTQFAPTVIGCEMNDNGNYGLVVPAVDTIVVQRLVMERCIADRNDRSGVALLGSVYRPLIRGGRMCNNGEFGIQANPFNGRTLTALTVDGVTILDNSQNTPGSLDGIRAEPNPGGTLNGATFIRSRIGGTSQRYGIHTTTDTAGWRIVECDLTGNATGPANYAGTKATGAEIKGTTNQVSVTNGDGILGDPTLSLPQDIAPLSSPIFAGLTLPAARNAADNGSFTTGTNHFTGVNCTPTITGGALRVEATSSSVAYASYAGLATVGHVYYIRYDIKPFRTHAARARIGGAAANSTTATAGAWSTGVSFRLTAISTASLDIFMNADSTTGLTSGVVTEFDNLMVIDLTATYGSGREPSKAEMDTVTYFEGTSGGGLAAGAITLQAPNGSLHVVTVDNAGSLVVTPA